MHKLTWLSVPLLLAVLLLGACSGGEEEVSGVDRSPTATGAATETATQPATTASPVTTATPAATPTAAGGSGGGGGGALAAMAEQFANATFKATYDVEGTSGGQAMSGEWTWYQDATERFRMDFSAEGASGTMISAEDAVIICSEGACFRMSASGSGSMPNPGAALSEQIEEFQAGAMEADVQPAGSREIAGAEAQCFEFDDSANNTSGLVCYSEGGIPLLMESESAEGEFRMEATSFEDSVSDADFEPPYPVSSLGS